MDTPNPWDRLPTESARAYEAFAAYRDMPVSERAYRAVARTLGKSDTLIARWGSTHKWTERVAAHDRHLEEQWHLEQAKARRKAAERQIRTAQLAQSKAAQRMIELDQSKLTVGELTRLWEVGVRIEREAMSDMVAGSTSRIDVTEDGGRLQVALTRFRELGPEQRRAQLAELAQEVTRRARAASDDDDR